MNYHNITTDDMKNGSGLRVVLWLSGCDHHCTNCQNPQTWDKDSGILFDDTAKSEIFTELDKDYIKGITFSGGDPLNINNRKDVLDLIRIIKTNYNDKDIWLYTGYTWEQIIDNSDLYAIVTLVDILVEGRFNEELFDVSYHWAGSTNQRVIDVPKTLINNAIVLYE